MISRLAAAALLAAAVAAALAGLDGEGLPCVAEGLCDGEAVGAGPIAQPGAAWSAMGLGAASIWLVGRGDLGDRTIGWALLLSCVGALWYHASLTVWSGRVDAAGVAAVAGAFLIRESVADERVARAAAAGALVVAAAAVTGLGLAVTLAAAAAGTILVLGRAHGRDHRLLAAAVALFGASGLVWWSGPHALWHLAAAGAVAVLAGHLGSGPIPHPPLRFRWGPL